MTKPKLTTNELWHRRLSRGRGGRSIVRHNPDGQRITVVEHPDGALTSNVDGELDDVMLAEYEANFG